MKRFILLIVSLCLIAGIVYMLTSRRQQRDPLELVPQKALLMLDWTDAAGAARGFLDSRFGRSLTSINWPSVMEQLEVQDQAREQLEEAAADLMNFLADPLFNKLFSKRIVVALLPIDPIAFAANPKEAVAKNLLMLVHSRHEQILPRFLSLVTTIESKVETLSYQGFSITVFVLQGGKHLYVSSVDGQLVVSPGLETVQQSIDLSLEHLVQGRTGFVLNSEYAKLKKRGRGKDDFFLYADFARLKPLLKVLRLPVQTGNGPSLPEFSGSKRMVFFHHSYKHIQQFTSIVQFDQEQLAPFQKTIYSREPLENRNLLNMPSGLLVYFWSNWLDLSAWWRTTLARGTEDELAAAKRIAAWIKTQTGMNIDEFLALFGQEFGFNVAEIRTSGFFPVPRICCCIEVTDHDRAMELIEKMLTGLPLRRDKVAGIPVVSIMAADGLMQPSYALLDRFLMVADSRKQIEDILRGGSKRLVKEDEFQAVDMGMLQPSNLVVFARTAKLMDGLKEFVSGVGTIIAIRDQAAAAKSKILIDQVILPLLEGLKMYEAKGVRSYTAPGEVVLDSVVLVSEPRKNELSSGVANLGK